MDIKSLASGSTGNCYVVRSSYAGVLLIECGITIERIRRGVPAPLPDCACLISHEHGDHSRSAAKLARLGVDMYSGAGTWSALGITGHRAHAVAQGERFTAGGFSVYALATVHDAAEPLGFLVSDGLERLLYATDTHYIKQLFDPELRINYFMVEINFDDDIIDKTDIKYRRTRRNHMSLETAEKFFTVQNTEYCKEIWLLHLSDTNSNAVWFQRRIMEITGKPVTIAGNHDKV